MNKKITDLPNASTLTGDELFEVVQGGINKKATQNQVKAHSSPNASEILRGIVELATVAEAEAGTDTERAVTPAGVSAAIQANEKFLGIYTSVASLESAYPTANPGNWASIDPGIGTYAVKYLWDEEDGWVSGGGGGASTFGELTGSPSENAALAAALDAKLNTGNNSGLAGTGLRYTYVNADGQIIANGNVTYNTTTGATRIDGLSSIADDFSLEIYNDDDEMIMRVSNGKYVEYGGSSSFWEVQSGISDGNAGIIFLPSQDIAYRLKDTGSFDYAICKSSTSGYGRAFIIKQKQVNNHGQGFETVRTQLKLTLPNTTAGASHIVGSIAVPSGYGLSVHVLRALAFATNGHAQTCEPFSAVGTNAAGTTSGTSTAPTAVRLTATTGGFSVVWNNTSDAADITFTNETGTGRQYDVLVDVEYILYPIPV